MPVKSFTTIFTASNRDVWIGCMEIIKPWTIILYISAIPSKVMIVGLGAVGGYVLEALARSGVGNFILVDFDKFEESNINRQIFAHFAA